MTFVRASLVIFACAAALAQQPRIDHISPDRGPIAGGTIITIDGANFTGAAVKLDRVAATPLSLSSTTMQLRMQPHDNGYVVITISNSSGTAYGEFLYVPPRLDDLPPGYVTTVAGVGNYVRTFGPATRAFVQPVMVAADTSGNLYLAEAGLHRVTRVDREGDIHEFASGNFFLGETIADGVPAIGGGVCFPFGVAIGPGGNVYIGTHGPLLRRVDPRSGLTFNAAGNNRAGFSGDGGPARDAMTGQVTSVAANASNVYFLDWENARIRRIDANGIISTVAGSGTIGYSGDGGPATKASFFFGNPDEGCIAVDSQDNLFIGDAQNGAIRRVDHATGTITTFYKPPLEPDKPDFAGVVRSLAVDAAGNVYYGGSGRIVKVNAKGEFMQAWGGGGYGLTDDGPITPAMRLGHIMGLMIDEANNIVFADAFFSRVRRINLMSGRLETIAGIYPEYQNENGPATAAPIMNENMDLAIGIDGNLLIGDFRVRRLDREGNLQTIAGGHPDPTLYDNVPADKMVNACLGMDVTADGGIDLANTGDIAHLDASGIYRRLGGPDGRCGYKGDGGFFSQAQLCQPWDSARDAAGNLYVADTNNNRIRRVDALTNVVTTFAGNGGPVSGIEGYGRGTFCGDGGAASSACLNTPYGLAVDRDGSVFISENWMRIRRVSTDGTINTFASGIGGISKIAFGPGRYLYGTGGVHAGRFDRSGQFTPLAGSGEQGFGGDGGPALLARINGGSQAAGVAVDREGNFYFQDSMNRRIRAVRYGAVLPPPGATLSASADGRNVRVTVRDATGASAPSVRVNFSVPSTGASCSLSSGFAITDENGTASVTCTPNCITGSYTVTAQPIASAAKATVTFTNAPRPCRRRAVRR